MVFKNFGYFGSINSPMFPASMLTTKTVNRVSTHLNHVSDPTVLNVETTAKTAMKLQ